MTRILVCGLSPLPFEETRRNDGPGLRSWQFASALEQAGHDVLLVAPPIPGVYEQPPTEREKVQGVEIDRRPWPRFGQRRHLAAIVRSWRPQALVGATVHGSYPLALLRSPLPFWADQFGHSMAEAQAKAALENDDWPLGYYLKRVRAIAAVADRISCVSERQRLACIGELGAFGRLTAANCGEELATVIPCAYFPERLPARSTERPLSWRGRIPEDAFVALWSGSFNVWSDVDTLFAGLERAMRTSESLCFVATGGAVPGQDESTYRSFERAISGSDLERRFLLEGWIPKAEVALRVAAADVGVLTEKRIYEGELGSKNRVLEWLASGLVPCCNRIGDLGDLLEEHEIGLTFEPGDCAGLSSLLVQASADPARIAKMASRGVEVAQRTWSVGATSEPLLEWAASATPRSRS